MAVFFLAEIEQIHDASMYERYLEAVAPIVREHGGEYIIRSDKITPVTGDWSAKRVIVLRFDTVEAMRACFHSEAYRQIAHLRENSTVSKSLLVEE